MKTQKLKKKGKGNVVPLMLKTSEKQKKPGKQDPQAVCYSAATMTPITHEMIAQRAWEIWMSKGCPLGQDKTNWYQAELELKIQGYQE